VDDTTFHQPNPVCARPRESEVVAFGVIRTSGMTILLREHEDETSGAPPNGRPVAAGASATRQPSPAVDRLRRSCPSDTPTRQFADLVLAPVDPSQRAALCDLLRQINEQTKAVMRGAVPGATILPFEELSGLHFARFVVLDIAGKPWLALATDYDGPEGKSDCRHPEARARHFAQLAALPGMRKVFAHCLGVKPGRLQAYFERHRRDASTCYAAAPGRSVRQIRWEADLRREVEALLSSPRASGQTPEQVRQHVRAALDAQQIEIRAFPPQPELEGKIYRAFGVALAAGGAATLGSAAVASVPLGFMGLAGFGVSLGATTAGLLAVAGLSVARFRWLESHDRQWQPKYDAGTHELMEHVATDENIFLQNQLTHVVEIKDGPLRSLLIRVVFSALQVLATYRYNRGKLGDIPTIHFARWVLGPERSVIFFSNFDSSWQSYLGDFIDKASSGLTAVWSNTKLYPRTEWLLTAGSRDAGRFLAWTRAHQKPTQVWYSAYPGLSVVNINANTEIRRGLADPAAVDPVSWLARLRNVDRTEVDQRFGEDQLRQTPLELSDIQGLILKGYGHKREARYLLLAVEQSSPALLAWLAELPVTSAAQGGKDRNAADPLLNVAFTYAGLRALHIEPELCDAFATPFVQGSSHEDRARTNGDVGSDAPSHWSWGGDDKPVHIALLIFASEAASLNTQVDRYRGAALEHGLRVIAELDAGTLEGRKEHFGFRDGIAQPVVRGSGDPGVDKNTIAAGEILLGHRDGYDNVAGAPTSRQGFRFGFNGSYMVLRQLEQDVGAFWTYCREQADEHEPLSAIQIASKMVGRWPSGAPIVRYPDKDPGGTSDDDSFGYFEVSADNDRYGGRCPFGAHIRRTNPRDWGLGASSEESTRLSNLHRIMRRGRPYGPPLVDSMNADELAKLGHDAEAPGAASERGLQFICFNANIERQFEFIQQQWCKNPKFAGQHSDADPLLGMRQPSAELGIDDPGLTIQTDLHDGTTKRLVAFKSFVKLRGSAYLFMPSLSALRLLPKLAVADTQALSRVYEQVPDDEQLHIDRLTDNIRRLLQKRYAGKQTLRDAHPKMHGCVQAVLEVRPDIPVELRHGLFADPPTDRKGWVRFSNEHHDPQSDAKKDTRGLALKLLNVEGAKLLDGEEASPCHDFIFLSTPRFVARDVAEFGELINALVNHELRSWLRSVPALYRHWRSVDRHASPLETEYFSVVPALLGPHAVKYIVRPQQKHSPLPTDPKPDYLRARLIEQLAEQDYCFDVLIQQFVDDHTTPIEDPTVAWRVPAERVATLRIPRQSGIASPERLELGENLAFNPFRCLPEHRPLGGINRARRQVYRTIAKFRHTRNGVSPSEVPGWPESE
jgi:Dyp-type peroxidase family